MNTKNMTDIVESTMRRIGVVAEYPGKRSKMLPYITKVRTSLMMTKTRFEGWSLLNVLDARPPSTIDSTCTYMYVRVYRCTTVHVRRARRPSHSRTPRAYCIAATVHVDI